MGACLVRCPSFNPEVVRWGESREDLVAPTGKNYVHIRATFVCEIALCRLYAVCAVALYVVARPGPRTRTGELMGFDDLHAFSTPPLWSHTCRCLGSGWDALSAIPDRISDSIAD